MVKDDSRLNSCNLSLGIKLKNVRHVLREIEHHGHIAALACERSPSAATEHRCTVLAASRNCGDYVIIVAGDDDPDWNLAVVGAIAGVERAAAIVEADFAADAAA
jgi:hypothetical protein